MTDQQSRIRDLKQRGFLTGQIAVLLGVKPAAVLDVPSARAPEPRR